MAFQGLFRWPRFQRGLGWVEFGCVSSRVPGPMVFVCVCTGQCAPGSALLDLWSSGCELYPPLQTLPLFSSVWPLCPGSRSLHCGLKVFLLVPPLGTVCEAVSL